MNARRRCFFHGVLLASLLCLAANSSGLAAPPATRHGTGTVTPGARVPPSELTTAGSDTGIPGTWQVQRFGTPLEMIFVDPTHGWSRNGTERTTDGGQTWTWAHAPGTSIATFVSPTEGWAGGGSFSAGDEMCHVYIDHTTDGGGSWSRQYTSPGFGRPATSTGCISSTTCMAGHSPWGGRVKTTDGGVTWQSANIGYGVWLKMLDRTTWFRLTVDGGSNCYPYDRTYKLSKTTDAGTTWMGVGDLPRWASATEGGTYIAPDGRFMIVVGEAGQIARSTDGGATWVDVPSPFTDDLSWVALADGTTGWAAGAGGAVLHTGDGGLTWTRQPINTTHDVTWLAAFGPNEALLRAGRLYRTADGGRIWQPLPYASNGTVTDFAALSADVVWAASGELAVTTDGGSVWHESDIEATAVDTVQPGHVWALGSQLWRSTDGGGHWTAYPAPPGSRYLDFVDPLHGWVIGGETTDDYHTRKIYATTDGGVSWQVQALPGDPAAFWPDFNQVVFVDAQHGWVTGQNVLLRTTNGGAAWERIGEPSNSSPDCRLSFITDREGWEACTSWPIHAENIHCNGVSHTTDGGISWLGSEGGCGFGDDPLYRAVSFLDASEGWVVGDGGWIRHTTDGGATWQEMYHPSSLSLRSVVAAAPGVAYIGGQNGIILRYDATASATTPAASRETRVGAGEPTLLPATSLLPTDREASAAPDATRTWYVAPGGNDSHACTSPGAPCASINAAMLKAADGDTLRVAAGRYYGTGNQVAVVYRDVTLDGGWNAGFTFQEGFSVLDGQQARRGLTVKSTATATVTRFVIENGRSGDAGGLRNYGSLVLQEATVRANTGGLVGGIVQRAGSLILANVSVTGNQGGEVGGILNQAGSLTLRNSAITDNLGDGAGGISSAASLNVDNCTLSENRSSGRGNDVAGAIYSCAGSLNISSSTIAHNFAPYYGGGITNQPYDDSTRSVRNSIIAGNGDDCAGWGSLRSDGYNLLGDNDCASATGPSTDLIGADARLGELIASGEGPRYHPLLAGSPAINAGNPAGCAGSAGPLPADQRGALRAGRCDIGAYEYTTPGAPSVLYAWEGAAQRTPPRSRYAIPLKGVVLDRAGSPVSGVTVSFTAPVAGASGTFAGTGGSAATVATNASGVALAPAFTANAAGGRFAVAAVAGGVPSPANFDLENAGWYVSSTGDDAAACASPGAPCASINAVLAKPGFRQGDGVLVAAGLTADQRVRLDKDTVLYGGWNAAFTGQVDRSTISGLDSSQTALIERFSVVGGGVSLGGAATLRDCRITGSTHRGVSVGGGAAILENCTIEDSAEYGITNDGAASISNSTIRGNARGGILSEWGATSVTNSTITANQGLGVEAQDGALQLNNVTITGNATGVRMPGGSGNWVRNSILAGNTASDCSGPVTSAGYNLIGSTAGCTYTPGAGDKIGVDPKLATLADNGGPTQTSALLPGSPAIDAGNPGAASARAAACSPPTSAARPVHRTATPTASPAATSARTKPA